MSEGSPRWLAFPGPFLWRVQKLYEAGVDGVLVVDLPPEEVGELLPHLRRAGIHFIFLLAPTSGPGRVRKVLRHARGFIYYVSVTGVIVYLMLYQLYAPS